MMRLKNRLIPIVVYIAVLGLLVLAIKHKGINRILKKNVFVKHVLQERTRAIDKKKITTLNFAIPSFSHLQNIFLDKETPEAESVEPYIFYYEKVLEVYPQMAEAYLFLGYCYFSQDNLDQAKQMFVSAQELNPGFFWTEYDLGVLALIAKDYPLAINHFNEVLKSDFEKTIKQMFSSKIYTQIFTGVPQSTQVAARRYKETIAKAVYYLGLSLKKMGKEEEGRALMQRAFALTGDEKVLVLKDKPTVQIF